VAASARLSWPLARGYLAVSVQDLMAADRLVKLWQMTLPKVRVAAAGATAIRVATHLPHNSRPGQRTVNQRCRPCRQHVDHLSRRLRRAAWGTESSAGRITGKDQRAAGLAARHPCVTHITQV